MSEKTYNGWSNYETWAVSLWIGNEEGSSNYWADQAQECFDEAEADRINTRDEAATYELSKRLKEQHEEALPELEGFVADLLGAAMSEVNWYEIAEHMIGEVEKQPREHYEYVDLA